MKNTRLISLLCLAVLFNVFCVVAIKAQALRWIGNEPEGPAPVSFGIPFSKGELKKNNSVILRDASGNVVASDKWTLASWPDGSVKWLGVAAVVPGSTGQLSFEKVKASDAAKMQRGAKTVKIENNESRYKVSTGPIDVYITPGRDHFIDSISLEGKKVAGEASLVCTTQDTPYKDGLSAISFENYSGVVESAEVERVGDIRALIKLKGRYVSSKGRQWLPFVLRMYFYAGSEQVKIVHSFIYDGNMDKDFIKGLGMRFEVPMREELYNRHVAFAADNGVWAEPVQPLVGRRVLSLDGKQGWQEAQMKGERVPDYNSFDEKNRGYLDDWASWSGFRLSQTSADAFTVRKRTHEGRPWVGTYSGKRAPGCVFVGDVSGGVDLAMNDFWESYPSALQVDSACSDVAYLTAWMWSPDAEPMDLRHYDYVAHGLEASYEDVQEGMSTPYGVARTHSFVLMPSSGYKGKGNFANLASQLSSQHQLACTPEYLHEKQAFGIWSLPDRSNDMRARVEDRLDAYVSFYKKMVEQHKWYGFWNYGDFMHSYDPVRHEWKYDVGGFAWDNTELASNMWLWYTFLRTGDAEVWKLAVAMTRHTSECDVYHIGPYAGLGSRHNVSHWGCGAKEARISQAAWNRFYYYLSTDERCGDLMSEVRDADQMLYSIDPMRLALPRSKYPCSAPARLRVGPDWIAYAGNWMTEWERTGNKKYRDKIVVGMKSMASLPNGLFCGPGVLGYDPDTGIVSYEGDESITNTNHLMTIMGGFQIMNEMMEMVDVPSWNKVWLEHAAMYHKVTTNKFAVPHLKAYAAYKNNDSSLAGEAWKELWKGGEKMDKNFTSYKVAVPEVPADIDENPRISTNDAALWSLTAIYMQEVIPQ